MIGMYVEKGFSRGIIDRYTDFGANISDEAQMLYLENQTYAPTKATEYETNITNITHINSVIEQNPMINLQLELRFTDKMITDAVTNITNTYTRHGMMLSRPAALQKESGKVYVDKNETYKLYQSINGATAKGGPTTAMQVIRETKNVLASPIPAETEKVWLKPEKAPDAVEHRLETEKETLLHETEILRETRETLEHDVSTLEHRVTELREHTGEIEHDTVLAEPGQAAAQDGSPMAAERRPPERPTGAELVFGEKESAEGSPAAQDTAKAVERSTRAAVEKRQSTENEQKAEGDSGREAAGNSDKYSAPREKTAGETAARRPETAAPASMVYQQGAPQEKRAGRTDESSGSRTAEKPEGERETRIEMSDKASRPVRKAESADAEPARPLAYEERTPNPQSSAARHGPVEEKAESLRVPETARPAELVYPEEDTARADEKENVVGRRLTDTAARPAVRQVRDETKAGSFRPVSRRMEQAAPADIMYAEQRAEQRAPTDSGNRKAVEQPRSQQSEAVARKPETAFAADMTLPQAAKQRAGDISRDNFEDFIQNARRGAKHGSDNKTPAQVSEEGTAKRQMQQPRLPQFPAISQKRLLKLSQTDMTGRMLAAALRGSTETVRRPASVKEQKSVAGRADVEQAAQAKNASRRESYRPGPAVLEYQAPQTGREREPYAENQGRAASVEYGHSTVRREAAPVYATDMVHRMSGSPAQIEQALSAAGIETVRKTENRKTAATVNEKKVETHEAINAPGKNPPPPVLTPAMVEEAVDINKITDKVYRALEARIRTEKMRRGL